VAYRLRATRFPVYRDLAGFDFATIELVNTLEQEKAEGTADQIANRLAHSDLVVLDELAPALQRIRRGAAVPSAEHAL
jgi:hypothetical protein